MMRPRYFKLYVVLFALVLPALIWKPIIVEVWRLSHGSTVLVGQRTMQIPYPWMLVQPRRNLFERFDSLLPYNGQANATIFFEATSSLEKAKLTSQWLADNERVFTKFGYSNMHSESISEGTIQCAEATAPNMKIAYCRSAAGISLGFAGSARLELQAIHLLDSK